MRKRSRSRKDVRWRPGYKEQFLANIKQSYIEIRQDPVLGTKLWILGIGDEKAYTRMITNTYNSDAKVAQQEKVLIQIVSYYPLIIKDLYACHGLNGLMKMTSPVNKLQQAARSYFSFSSRRDDRFLERFRK